MARGNQRPGCRGGGLGTMEKTLSPKRRGCGEGCVWLLGEGCYLWGHWAELQRQTLKAPGSEQTLAPPPPPAEQLGTSASLPAETPHRPGVWRGARLPAPAPTLRGSRPAARRPPLWAEQGRGQGSTYRDLRLQPPRSPRREANPDGTLETGAEGPSLRGWEAPTPT